MLLLRLIPGSVRMKSSEGIFLVNLTFITSRFPARVSTSWTWSISPLKLDGILGELTIVYDFCE